MNRNDRQPLAQAPRSAADAADRPPGKSAGSLGSDATSRRHTQSPFTLMASALGSPRDAVKKAARLARLLAGYVAPAELDARLNRLHHLGIIEVIPSRLQLVCGARDMVRFWIVPAAADYYADQKLSFGFHQLLRFLDEPASLADPVGFFSTRDGIIGHLMQVVHANPLYDLELLQMFDDGLDELSGQLEAMLAGTHPRAAAIGAIVEETDYHQQLRDFVQSFRRDPAVPALLRKNVSASPHFLMLEQTFGSLRTAMRYFCRLPATPLGAARHLLFVKAFPEHLGEAAQH